MLSVRVMPCLLLRRRGLVKTVKFKDAAYIGDPINTVRIFNEMEVDELVFLDITASPENKAPQFDLIEEIANECFMPFGYGGGLRSVDDIHRLFDLGAEKAVLNTVAIKNRTSSRRPPAASVRRVSSSRLTPGATCGAATRCMATAAARTPSWIRSSMPCGWPTRARVRY